MSKPDTALAAAAAGFDEELAAYTRLGDLFIKTPVASVKQLERANGILTEIAACEERLQAAGQRMVGALAAARAHQEQLAHDVVARVPVVQARNRRLNELMAELTAVAGEVGSLNSTITGHGERGRVRGARDPGACAPSALARDRQEAPARRRRLSSAVPPGCTGRGLVSSGARPRRPGHRVALQPSPRSNCVALRAVAAVAIASRRISARGWRVRRSSVAARHARSVVSTPCRARRPGTPGALGWQRAEPPGNRKVDS